MASDKPIIVGLCGYGRVGKDTVAEILKMCGFQQVAFADPLRELALLLDVHLPAAGGSYRTIVERCGYDDAKAMFPCVREHLVALGHGGRTAIGPTVWIDAALSRARKHPRVVVSDVRYPNEAEAIHALGGVVWRIERPGVGPANETEAASVPQVLCDAVIENDGLHADLITKVLALFTEWRKSLSESDI